MAARKLKCFWCLNTDEKVEMEKLSKGYIHREVCLISYNKDKEFKCKEFEKKVELSETIAEVYQLESIQMIPSQIYPYIEDMRNDSKLFGKLGKSYKNGIKYEAIALTFLYCKDTLREIHRTKEFKNFLMELRYALAVIKNNLVDCKNDFEMKLKQQKSLEIKKSIEFISTETEEDESKKYIKNDNDDDISDLLD